MVLGGFVALKGKRDAVPLSEGHQAWAGPAEGGLWHSGTPQALGSPQSNQRGRNMVLSISSSCPWRPSDQADRPLSLMPLPCQLRPGMPTHPAYPGCSEVAAGLGELQEVVPSSALPYLQAELTLPTSPPVRLSHLPPQERVHREQTPSCLVRKMICSKKERDSLPLPDKTLCPCLSQDCGTGFSERTFAPSTA